jgi:hypothetical protein
MTNQEETLPRKWDKPLLDSQNGGRCVAERGDGTGWIETLVGGTGELREGRNLI